MSRWQARLQQAESAAVRAMRAPAARWVGLALGLVGFGVLARELVTADRAVLAAWWGPGLVAAFAGFAALHACGVASLHLLGGVAPARVWTTAQVVKYLPAPGSAMLGMVGASIREGHTAKMALGVMTRQQAVLVGGSVLVGSVAVGAGLHGRLGGWAGTAMAAATAVAGLGLLVWATRGRPATARVVVALLGCASLAVPGLGLVLAMPDPGHWMVTALALPAAWAAGLLVLPVPAGIGVRESVIMFLLAPSVGVEAALAFALVGRVIHTLSDAVAILVVRAVPVLRRVAARVPD